MTGLAVAGREIPAEAIAAEAQNHPAADGKAAWHAAARALAVRALLLAEAARQGLPPDIPAAGPGRRPSDEDAAIETLLARELRTPEPDEASCRRYYENNRARFRSPDLVEAWHILFAARPEDTEAYAAATARAETAIAALTADPAAFADAARRHSDCPSAADGGSLGQLGRGQTVSEFETFLFNLEEGQLCPVPVKTRYGVHVVKVGWRVAGQELPFEAVRERIADYLAEASWRRAAAQYLRLLAGRHGVEGIDLGAAATPLVQ